MSVATRKEPPNLRILKLTFLHFATGMALYLAALAAAVWLVPDLVRLGSARNPEGWILAHLLLIGFATTVAMGASFQITQVILRTSLFSRGLGYVQYGFHMLGFFGLLAGLFADMRLAVAGGACLLAGGVLYAVNLGATMARRRERNLFVFGSGLSVLALLAAMLLGAAMGLSFAYGWNAVHHGRMFGSHLWSGIGGWLAGLILVYSFKLLPMFYVSRKKLPRSSYAIVGLHHLGVWLQVAAQWGSPGPDPGSGAGRPGLADSIGPWLDDIGTILLLIAWGWFAVYLLQVRRLIGGKQPVGAVKVAFWLIPAVGVLFLAWSVLKWAGADGDGRPRRSPPLSSSGGSRGRSWPTCPRSCRSSGGRTAFAARKTKSRRPFCRTCCPKGA